MHFATPGLTRCSARRNLVVLGLLLCCFASRPARAGNEEEHLFGPAAALTAGAVTATVDEGSAIHYNPAGLAKVELATLDVNANAFVLRHYSAPDLLTAPVEIDNAGSFTEFISVPSGLTFVRPISDELRAGFGIFTTQASNILVRGQTQIPLGEDPDGYVWTSAWMFRFQEAETVTEVGASLAWKVSPSLRLGITLQLQYTSGSYSELSVGGVTDMEIDEPKTFVHQFDVGEWSDFELAPVLGLQWESGGLHLGLALQTPGLYLGGTYAYEDGATALYPYDPEFPEDDDRGILELDNDSYSEWELQPESFTHLRAGVAYDWGRGHVALDGDLFFQPWDKTNPKLPNFNLRVGTQVEISEMLSVGAGLFSDRSMDEYLLYPGTYVVDLYGGTLGVRFGDERLLADSEKYPLMGFETTLAIRYAQGSGQISGLRVPDDYGRDMTELETTSVRLDLKELTVMVGSSVYF